MSDKLCTLNDLRAILYEDSYWSVDNEGNAVELMNSGELGEVNEYYCSGCSESFEADDSYHVHAAWRNAVAHLMGGGKAI